MPSPSPRTTYSVSELAELLRRLLADTLPGVWVSGEISNFSRPASGHWYFTLKDEGAQLRCAMFRNNNYLVRPPPRDGDAVLVRARVTLYPARGDLQLVVEHLEPAGTGALLRAFEQLKAKLAAEGLFDPGLKRPLPKLPRCIGVVTSGTGAAWQDIRQALARRWPLAEVILASVPVQGKDAPPAIVRALAALPGQAPVDVILLARGGGSLEDLWAFNEEPVARAIRACLVPVVSGVGHEIDFTIADFAADLRAATPTAAAELATPDIAEFIGRIDRLAATLGHAVGDRLDRLAAQLAQGQARLAAQHPRRRLDEGAQRLDELDQRLRHAMRARLAQLRERLAARQRQWLATSPQRDLGRRRAGLESLAARLQAAGGTLTGLARTRVELAAARLLALSPQAVLARGYALASDADGRLIRDAAKLRAGDTLRVRFARGAADAEVVGIDAGVSGGA